MSFFFEQYLQVCLTFVKMGMCCMVLLQEVRDVGTISSLEDERDEFKFESDLLALLSITVFSRKLADTRRRNCLRHIGSTLCMTHSLL